jgi:hypothetical protein
VVELTGAFTSLLPRGCVVTSSPVYFYHAFSASNQDLAKSLTCSTPHSKHIIYGIDCGRTSYVIAKRPTCKASQLLHPKSCLPLHRSKDERTHYVYNIKNGNREPKKSHDNPSTATIRRKQLKIRVRAARTRECAVLAWSCSDTTPSFCTFILSSHLVHQASLVIMCAR